MKIDCPPVGPTSAKIVIVGEAPGANEKARRTPFIGASGKLLDGILASVGIPRSSCYVTNVIKEQPYKNEISQFINLGRKDPIAHIDTQAHLQYFAEEMAALDPNIIIALGNIPLWALTGNRGIQKWRGSLLTSDEYWDRPVKILPTLHPAYCIREYEGQYLLRYDLIRACKHGRDRTIPLDPYEYVLEPSFEQCIDFLDQCKQCRRTGVDIEVARREVSCISFSPTAGDSTKPSGRAISIPFWSPGRGHMCTPPQEAELWKKINEVLTSETEIIFHNAAFDATFLLRRYGIQVPRLQDTMVAQAILWPDFPKSLAFTTSLYTEMPYYKDEGKEGLLRGGGTYKESDHQFWLYNAKDAVVLPEIFKGQEEHLHRQGNWKTYCRQRDCIQPILYMSTVGIRVDQDSIRTESKRVEAELNELQEKINTLSGRELNPNSPKQLKEYFFVECNQPPTKRHGKITTDDKALKVIKRRGLRGSDVAGLIQDFRALKKFGGTYLNMSFDDDGRLRSSINPVGTETGRFSSSQTIFGTGGNMQNMPYSFRSFLVPDDGFVGFEVDLSQAENRIVALLAGEETMLQAFDHDLDIHSLTASLILTQILHKEVRYEDISDEKGTHPLLPQRSERYLGKQANHASNYDMGANTASLLWGTTIPQTNQILNAYHRAYPRIREWHRSVIYDAKQNGQTITNLMGRSRTYLGRWGVDLHHKMFAFLASSLVADHINEYGILELWRGRYDDYRGVQLLMQIHDSLLFQVNLSLGWSGIAIVLRKLCSALELPVTKGPRSIVVPTNVKIYPNNFAEGYEWKSGRPGPTALKEMYEKMKR